MISRNKFILGFLILSAAVVSPEFSFAQSDAGIFSGPASLIIAMVVLLLLVIILMGERLIRTEASQVLGDEVNSNFSLLPSFSEIFGKGNNFESEVGEPYFRIRKGFDLKLEGTPENRITEVHGSRYAITPTSFEGISPIPKLTVEVGEYVKAGDELFYDKKKPEIRYVAPVSGEVIEVNRGAKRRITEVVILPDKELAFKVMPGINEENNESIVDYLLQSGGWSMLRQRPFNIVPDPSVEPSNIFVTSFDTAPFAPETSMVIDDREAELKKGLEILAKLTSGKVYLGMNGGDDNLPDVLKGDLPAEKVWFSGPHPAGNVGVQIHRIKPVRSGDVIWTLGLQELITLGGLFTKGIYDATRILSVGGNMVENPAYVRTKMGCVIEDILKHFELSDLENTRIISGDVLSGVKVEKENFVGVFDDQLSLIKEGDYYEPFGWLIPQKMRPSLSRTFPNFIFPNVKYEADSNTHGERRAFVVSGQYERVLPMDIYPQQLMKAILTNDFEKMEGLGIRELVEEDVALCEFVCTSKMPLQKILREGLDEIQEQG